MFQRSTFQCSHVQRSTFVTTQAAWRSAIEIAPGRLFAGRPHRRGFNRMPELSSAIEIAPGRLFAGRPPAWTLPRRPHRRSPGAKRPLRRGFNRMPELDRTVQRLKSPLEGFSPGVHLRGRCHGDRIGGRPARSVRSGAVSTACLSSYVEN